MVIHLFAYIKKKRSESALSFNVDKAVYCFLPYASLWMPAARPDGSALFWKLASQANASTVEQATDLPCGTHFAALSSGKWPSKIVR
jgi:hypothetical protein